MRIYCSKTITVNVVIFITIHTTNQNSFRFWISVEVNYEIKFNY